MSAQIVFVRVHELDATQELLQEALKLTRTIAADDPSADVIFSKAVDLLAARVTLMPQPTMPMGALDLGTLRNGR